MRLEDFDNRQKQGRTRDPQRVWARMRLRRVHIVPRELPLLQKNYSLIRPGLKNTRAIHR
jgi:hypothetical protein